jgi:hypothetical protein
MSVIVSNLKSNVKEATRSPECPTCSLHHGAVKSLEVGAMHLAPLFCRNTPNECVRIVMLVAGLVSHVSLPFCEVHGKCCHQLYTSQEERTHDQVNPSLDMRR